MTQSNPAPRDPRGGQEVCLSREYLLGRLDEAAAEQVQARLLEDEEWCAEIQSAEDDLLDDWAQGRLAGEDRAGFESRYLASGHGRSRAAFALALARRVAAAPSAPSRGLLLALAACLVLGLSTLWLAAQNEALRRRAHAPVEARQTPAALPIVAALTLDGDTTRGAAALPRLDLTGSPEFARLTLRIDPNEPHSQYAAAVVSGGATLWERTALSTAGAGIDRAVTLWLPAAALAKGRIEIRLDKLQGAVREPVAFYEFIVD